MSRPDAEPEALVRRAGLEDLSALEALEGAFGADRFSRRQLRHLVARAHGACWVVEEAGRIVGDAVVLFRRGDPVARLHSLVVAPPARGRGLGGRLLDVVEAEASARGRREVRLDVREDNATARALYLRRGYRPLGRRSGHYHDGTAAIRMRKPLVADEGRFVERPAGQG